VWITGVEKPYVNQVTKRKDDEAAYSIIGWAGENRLVLRQFDDSNYEEYYFPEYVGHYVETGATRRGIPISVILVIEIESGKKTELFNREGYASADISATGKYLAVDWEDGAQK